MVGVTFTTLGILKLYGSTKGIVDGGGRPFSCRLFGSYPSWSRQVNLIVPYVFLAIGIVNLCVLLREVLAS